MKYIFFTIIQTFALMVLLENAIIDVTNNNKSFTTFFIAFAISIAFEVIFYKVNKLEKELNKLKENEKNLSSK